MTLIEKLGSDSYAVRSRARRHLLKQDPAAIDDLVDGLKHANWRVRKGCAEVLDHVGDESCAAPLAEALDDPIADVRRHALHSLICDRCKTVPLDVDVVGLVAGKATDDPSLRIRRIATTLLCLIPATDDRTFAALRRNRRDGDAEIRRRARWSLRNLERREEG